MLMGVGGAGLLADIAVFFDILPLPANLFSKYLTCGVMGALFLLFVVMGAVALRDAKLFTKKAETDVGISTQIREWCKTELTAEVIDNELPTSEELSDEEKYFCRVDTMKKRLTDKFMHLDEDFLEHLIDELYDERFEA